MRQELGFNPQGALAHGAAFASSGFRNALKDDANYFLVREHFSRDLAASKPALGKVAEMYRERYHKDMDGASSRAFTATMTLADAINRAGATQPDAIRKALAETNLTSDQIIMPWPGIKFDATGQNVLSRGIMVQTQNQTPKLVWPFAGAAADLVWPRPPWK